MCSTSATGNTSSCKKCVRFKDRGKLMSRIRTWVTVERSQKFLAIISTISRPLRLQFFLRGNIKYTFCIMLKRIIIKNSIELFLKIWRKDLLILINTGKALAIPKKILKEFYSRLELQSSVISKECCSRSFDARERHVIATAKLSS